MAKDYDSFRQALIDLLPGLIPDWSERRVADQGMMLLETLAYVGDQLSYYQDSVANEAFLETARQRISVRRHGRLIDYDMHEGLSARTVVQLQMSAADVTLTNPVGEERIIRVITRPRSINVPNRIPATRKDEVLDDTETIFEIKVRELNGQVFHRDLNELPLYNWLNQIAYLPTGATSADLAKDYMGASGARLQPGDLLLFEELLDPYTGEILTADPNRRHLVRLVDVEQIDVGTLASDSTESQKITRVFWDEEDALPFRIWISNVTEQGDALENISVGRGNLVIADEGRTQGDHEYYPHSPASAEWEGFKLGLGAFRFTLDRGPLAYSIPLKNMTNEPARKLFTVDPSGGEPAIHSIRSYTKSTYPDRPRTWHPQAKTLLNSDRFAEDVVIETDNLGRAQLRFGTNEYGAIPDENSIFDVSYRVGGGAQGNIGADKLSYILLDKAIGGMDTIQSVRNPLPAWGGSAPESMEQVKRLAPAAMRSTLKRAVTENDYARVAELDGQVERAVAQFRWTGSWHTVFIRVDPKGTNTITPELRSKLVQHVSRYAMTGYDIEIIDPIFIPLKLSLDICVEPTFFPTDVEQVVMEVLSNKQMADGRRGFFHPDQFTFGQPLYLSGIYAAVESVTGVQSVKITGLHRQDSLKADAETAENFARGYVSTGDVAVLRLDNDPDFPENGLLQLTMLGGNA